MSFINRNYPQFSSLYKDIHIRKDKTYWHDLDEKISVFAENAGLKYIRNIDPDMNDERTLPVIVNYFFHDKIVNK